MIRWSVVGSVPEFWDASICLEVVFDGLWFDDPLIGTVPVLMNKLGRFVTVDRFDLMICVFHVGALNLKLLNKHFLSLPKPLGKRLPPNETKRKPKRRRRRKLTPSLPNFSPRDCLYLPHSLRALRDYIKEGKQPSRGGWVTCVLFIGSRVFTPFRWRFLRGNPGHACAAAPREVHCGHLTARVRDARGSR